jgi:YD repeat-containing protein
LRRLLAAPLVAGLLLISQMAQTQETAQYTYDALGRLTGATYAGGPRAGKQSQLQYDPAGNRTAQAYGLPPPGPNNTVSFSITVPTSVSEGQPAVFTITKSAASSGQLSVSYSTSAGTAVSPGDFTAISGSVSFLGWETVKTISVPVIDDGVAEGAETFSMSISSPTSPATLGVSSATATIAANGANQPPVAQPDSILIAFCQPRLFAPTANDTDPEGDYPLYLVSMSNSNLVDFYWDTAAPNPTVTFTSTGIGGTGTLTYQVRDNRGATSNGTIFFTANASTNCNDRGSKGG